MLVAVSSVAPASGTSAEPCAGDDGVVVVVDFAELGGGARRGCDANGGNAASNFTDAGFGLTFATEEATFVCRVAGKPADDPCTDAAQANAYWSLWWSDGESGDWVYASLGVNGLTVPEGGYVAFAWHQGGGRATAPSAAPTPREANAPSADPDDRPSSRPTRRPGGSGKSEPGRASSDVPTSGTPTGTTEGAEPSTDTTAGPTGEGAGGSGKNRRRNSVPPAPPATSDTAAPASPTTEVSDLPEGLPASMADAESSDDTDGAVSLWLAGAAAVLVFGAAGAVPILRRRRG